MLRRKIADPERLTARPTTLAQSVQVSRFCNGVVTSSGAACRLARHDHTVGAAGM
jgi:hypothetical protein